jgi:cobalt-zinc-cadmium efflux system membrane fusion protein
VISAQAAVREAKSEIDLANSRLEAARETLGRQKAFARTGAFSQPALQTAQRELADAEAELERGKQDQAVHQAQLERAERLYSQELISRTELEQAKLEVETDKIRQRNAERRIELAKATNEREQRIATQNLANNREIQTAEADVRAADLELQQAKIRHASALSGVTSASKGVEAARVAYAAQAGGSRAGGGTLVVSAPISGTISYVEVTLGQAVERATEVCEIQNLRSVWIAANVPEKQVPLVRKGATAHATVSAYPGRIFNGVVQIVGSKLDPKNRTMPIQVLVDNVSGALKSEMFATVALGVGSRSMALAVPRSAIIEDGDRRLLYVEEEEGKYEEKVVELGRMQADLVEVISGLDRGSRVVTKGAFVLKSEKAKGELKGHGH